MDATDLTVVAKNMMFSVVYSINLLIKYEHLGFGVVEKLVDPLFKVLFVGIFSDNIFE